VVYRVQVGAFSDIDNAKSLVEDLKAKGYPAIMV
jgi:N-acetylmuramoyl-L-alanine amidase